MARGEVSEGRRRKQDVRTGKQTHRHIGVHELRHVHVSKRPHEDRRFIVLGRCTFEGACHDQDGFERTELEIIVVLLGELCLRELV